MSPLLCALALAAAAFVAVGQPAQAAPTEIVDAIGRKVVVETPVRRVIVSFYYEEFTAVAGKEGWSRVVGMSRMPWEGWRPAIFGRYKPVIPNLAAMPDIGHTDDSSFSAEKVIALRPDVLFWAEFSYSTLKTAREQIEAAGIPIIVLDYNAQMLDRHLASTRALGRVMGTEARAEELAALYERQYNDTLARIARAPGPKPKVYVELGQAGADAIGNTYNNTMWGRILTTLGADNIATGRIPGPWGPLSQETVIAENPDLILIAGSSWLNRPKAVRTGYDVDEQTTRQSLAQYAARPGWADLKAVRSGNVHAIEHGICRTLFDFAGMQYIAKHLYPDQFRDVDPLQSLKDYHARYLPVTFSGTWMLPLKP